MCISPFLLGEGDERPIKFSKKGGAWEDFNFDSGVGGKEGLTFFRGGLQFRKKNKKNKTKSKIFNDKNI